MDDEQRYEEALTNTLVTSALTDKGLTEYPPPFTEDSFELIDDCPAVYRRRNDGKDYQVEMTVSVRELPSEYPPAVS